MQKWFFEGSKTILYWRLTSLADATEASTGKRNGAGCIPNLPAIFRHLFGSAFACRHG
jgi:hypothetical protein